MKKTTKYLLSIFLYIIFSIILLIAISSPQNASWWTKNISSIYYVIVGNITNWFFFSFFELIVILFIILLIRRVIILCKSFKTKRFSIIFNKIYKLFSYILKLCLIYTAVAGVAFYREGINLPLYNKEMTPELVYDALAYFEKDYVELSKSFSRDKNNVSKCPYTFKELSSLMQNEMHRLDTNPYFTKNNFKVKGTWFSPLLSEFHVTGINFAYTAEANVNYIMPSIDIPFTIAHELAHLKGVMREDDANLTALYVCLTSEIPYVRYSGYFRGFYSLLEIKQLTKYDEYEHFISQLSNEIILDNRDYVDYFKKHDMLNKISNFFNNLYLKFYGQKDGTGSYNDVSEIVDSGKKDEDGNTIYNYIEYSPYQKLMMQLYVDKINK